VCKQAASKRDRVGYLEGDGVACSLCQQQRDIAACLAPGAQHAPGALLALDGGDVGAAAPGACQLLVCSPAACASVAQECLLCGPLAPLPALQHPAALHHAPEVRRVPPSYVVIPQAGAQAHAAQSWASLAALVGWQVHCSDMRRLVPP